MSASLKRVALANPNISQQDGKNRYVVAQMSIHSGEVKMYEYDREISSSRLVAHATDLPGLRTITWSPHPSYDCLLAYGTPQGKIQILDLNSRSMTHQFPTSLPSLSGPNVLGTLSLAQNRSCQTLAFSQRDPAVLVAGFEKTKSLPALFIWDLERSLSSFAPGSGHRGNQGEKIQPHPQESETKNTPSYGKEGSRPLQQYLPGEGVQSLSTFHHTNTLVLAGTSSKSIRCLDLRLPSPSDPSSTIQGEKGVAFNLPTRAFLNLCTSTLYPHLFASSEEGLMGIVKIWDTRFLRTGSHPSFASSSGTGAGGFTVGFGLGGTAGTGAGATTGQGSGEICSYEASGRGGISNLVWDPYASGRGGQRLGVGTKEGGVLVFDVQSGQTVDGGREPRFGRPEGEVKGSGGWTVMTGVKSTKPAPDPGLQTFTFLSEPGSGKASVLSIFRDNSMTIEETGVAPLIAAGQQGDTAVSIVSQVTRIEPSEQDPSIPSMRSPPLPGNNAVSTTLPLPRGRTRSQRGSQRTNMNVRNLSLNRSAILSEAGADINALDAGRRHTSRTGPVSWQRTFEEHSPSGNVPRPMPSTFVREMERSMSPGASPRAPITLEDDVSEWNDVLGMDISMAMRRKAMMDFGLEFSANDMIETKIPTTGGFLFEWLDRFIRLMGLSEMRSVPGFDFTLQGVHGVWNGHAISNENKPSPKDRELQPESFLYSKAVSARSPRMRAGKLVDSALEPDYVAAMEGIMKLRSEEFLDSTLPVETSKRTHRKFMLAICGELTGTRLEMEILRISQTHLTKAAWIALVNSQKARAVRMLKQSESDTHRMLSSFLQQGRIDQAVAKELRLSDPYMRAMVNYLAGGTSWEITINDLELPLLDRIVLAIRFVNDGLLSTFLENQTNMALQHGSLQGIPLTGLGQQGINIISRYVDVTGDIQVAAILGATVPRPTAQVTRWIEEYRDMLDAWKMHRGRVMFDMSRGNIARWYGDEIKIPKQVVVRCNFCQKNITGGEQKQGQAIQGKTRTSCCPTCKNRLPRCVICLLQIDMVPPDGPPQDTLESAFVFCQTCHHGGHYHHIMLWFYGDEDEAGSSRHETCPVAGCHCNCASLR